MIDRKDSQTIGIMREGGVQLGTILADLLKISSVGTNLLDIEAEAVRKIKEAGGTPSFQTVEGYKWATCLCVNEAIVHGIPHAYILKESDVFTIDIGMLYKGFHTDTAWTKIITNDIQHVANEKKKFLEVGEEALWKAIDQARLGNRVGHITQVIQQMIEGAGYSVVRTLVGHGVGKILHEEPQIPGSMKGPLDSTPLLVDGMTIAIEVIYAQGKGNVVYDSQDGWTISTKDRSLSAVFEHTIAITPNGPLVLTKYQK